MVNSYDRELQRNRETIQNKRKQQSRELVYDFHDRSRRPPRTIHKGVSIEERKPTAQGPYFTYPGQAQATHPSTSVYLSSLEGDAQYSPRDHEPMRPGFGHEQGRNQGQGQPPTIYPV